MKTCPFADPAFCPGPDVPCPVCGMPGHAASWEEDMCVGDNEDTTQGLRAPAPAMHMCPTCGRSDDEYIKSQLPCADRWHAEDHPRHREAARSAASTVEPAAWQTRYQFPNGEWDIWRDCSKATYDQMQRGQKEGLYSRNELRPLYAAPTTSPEPERYTQEEMDEADREADAIHTALHSPEPDAVREALQAIYEWYDRDGSVGGASDVFEDHRDAVTAALSRPAHGDDVWSASKHDEIIKRLMAAIGQPNSQSVYGAFKQFANELHALAHPRNDRDTGGPQS